MALAVCSARPFTSEATTAKPAACFTCTCRLDRRVEGQKVRLSGDLLDEGDDLADLLGGCGERLHAGVGFGGADVRRRKVLEGQLRLVRDVADRAGELIGGFRDGDDVGGGVFAAPSTCLALPDAPAAMSSREPAVFSRSPDMPAREAMLISASERKSAIKLSHGALTGFGPLCFEVLFAFEGPAPFQAVAEEGDGTGDVAYFIAPGAVRDLLDAGSFRDVGS